MKIYLEWINKREKEKKKREINESTSDFEKKEKWMQEVMKII